MSSRLCCRSRTTLVIRWPTRHRNSSWRYLSRASRCRSSPKRSSPLIEAAFLNLSSQILRDHRFQFWSRYLTILMWKFPPLKWIMCWRSQKLSSRPRGRRPGLSQLMGLSRNQRVCSPQQSSYRRSRARATRATTLQESLLTPAIARSRQSKMLLLSRTWLRPKQSSISLASISLARSIKGIIMLLPTWRH